MRSGPVLEIHRHPRVRLIQELGVEPSPQLRRPHQAVLTVDPRLDIFFGPQRAFIFDLFAA
ncbi:BTAD domain-containing putative transcriptional regulator [Streptomyces sp. NPDC050388]|uniref:BTAD domain-containing putative transcriptional regulator n=1 Tax=Streptomyces sp. NPDC050388 TaxID=3155781 RepID=UPI00341C4860